MNERPSFDETVDFTSDDAKISPQASANRPELPHLQLLDEIARGGMGAILKGRDLDLGRDLAVKVLLEAHQGKPEMLQRFLEEAQIAGQLQHPGIAPVHELGELPDGRPYFTMKLVKGQTLAALLAARKDVLEDRPRFLGIFAQVCQTLAYAHAHRVIHRDLKPSNIMVGAFGEVQVMDWGLAKVLKEGDRTETPSERPRAENLSIISTQRGDGASAMESGSYTQAGTMLGTPAYMAPEQARGDVEQIEERADVFGLGAILCEILTGRPLYTGTGAEIQYKARTAKLDDAFTRLDACMADRELIDLGKRCLAAEPSDRPRHAGEVAEQVTAYQNAVAERLHQAELARAAEEARTIEARATVAQERKARRMTVALAATMVLTVLLGGGVWLGLRGQRQTLLAENNRSLQEALTQATALREQSNRMQGRAARELAAQAREKGRRAEALVEIGPVDAALAEQVQGLLRELDADEKDRQLLASLEETALVPFELDAKERRFTWERVLPMLRDAFRVYGMPAGEGDVAAAAGRIEKRSAAVREAVLAGLQEWIVLAEWPALKVEEPHLDWLRALRAKLKTTEPEGWGIQVREAALEKNPAKRRAALEKLAESADVSSLPARAVIPLVQRLQGLKAHASVVTLLRRVQSRHPSDFRVNILLAGELTVFQKQLPEALSYARVALALQPDSATAHLFLSMVLGESGRSDEAIFEAREAIRLNKDSFLAYDFLGFLLLKRGRQTEAIAQLREAIRLSKDYPEAHVSLGTALADKGQLDEAISAYRKAINIDPKHVGAYRNLGSALQRQGKLEEAITAYRKAVELEPNNAQIHLDLGFALESQNKFDNAITEYRKCIECDPKCAQAYLNLGNTWRKQGKLDEAISAYRKVIDLDPKFVWAYRNLGNLLRAQGKLDEAIAAFREAIQLEPKFAPTHIDLGLALWTREGRPQDGLTELRTAVKLEPKNAFAHDKLAWAFFKLRYLDESLKEYRAAVELDPKLAWAHNGAGLVLKEQGKLDEAIAAFRKARELEPKNAQANLNLYYALKKQGKLDEADALIRKATGAFLADAQQTGDPYAWHRYNAACFAALAGSGKGGDKLDDKESSRRRKQALDWLRADLALYGTRVDAGKPEDRALVRQRLQHWRKDSDLAGIRDKDAVAKLPAGEREECRRLWAEVETLLQRAAAK